MGHSEIDDIEFKINIIINDTIFFSICQSNNIGPYMTNNYNKMHAIFSNISR
jgi:hypothetical protein